MRMESTPEQRAAGGQHPPFGLGLPVEVGGLGMACTRPDGFFHLHGCATLRHPVLAWHPLGARCDMGNATNRSRWVGYLGRDRQRIPVWIAWQRRTAAPEPAVELCGHDILASKFFASDAPVPRCAISVGHISEAGSGLYLMMAFGIASIHFVIFGLSTYSHFAQIGTTANRFLLQTLPVFIVTISAASQLMWRQQVLTRTANRPLRGPLTYGLTLVGLALVGTLPLVILAMSRGQRTDHALRYDAAELSPVIGEWVEREQDSNLLATIYRSGWREHP